MSYDKKYNGYQIAKKIGAEDANCGWQIKLARLRRNLSIAQVAKRATCSSLTVSRIEKGAPTVAISIYIRVLYALQSDDDLLLLAKEDAKGKALQDLSLKKQKSIQKRVSYEETCKTRRLKLLICNHFNITY